MPGVVVALLLADQQQAQAADVIGTITEVIASPVPLGIAVMAVATMGAIAATAWLISKARVALNRASPFDVGGGFDHYYSRILPAARSGVLLLIYAGYAVLWLARWPARQGYEWLRQPFGSTFLGGVAAIGVLYLLGRALVGLVTATWCAGRWLGLEARGIVWHTVESGDAFRILWVRPNREYLFDTTIRDHRLNEEMLAQRQRRTQLATAAGLVLIALIGWRALPPVIEHFYPLLSPGFVSFLKDHAAPALLAQLVFLFGMIPATISLIAELFNGLVYRLGAQYIPGANVTGERPVPITRKQVEAQMVHGDEGFASPLDAVRRMAGNRDS